MPRFSVLCILPGWLLALMTAEYPGFQTAFMNNLHLHFGQLNKTSCIGSFSPNKFAVTLPALQFQPSFLLSLMDGKHCAADEVYTSTLKQPKLLIPVDASNREQQSHISPQVHCLVDSINELLLFKLLEILSLVFDFFPPFFFFQNPPVWMKPSNHGWEQNPYFEASITEETTK